MTDRHLLIAWLNDAHGMENALVQVLEHQVKDAKDYPQIQARIQQHLEQTRRHADLEVWSPHSGWCGLFPCRRMPRHTSCRTLFLVAAISRRNKMPAVSSTSRLGQHLQ
jgi:hypothetical protein